MELGWSWLSLRMVKISQLPKPEDCHGYAVEVDMTHRDLQNDFKQGGRPWEDSESLRSGSGDRLHQPKAVVGAINSGAIELLVNDKTEQKADLDELVGVTRRCSRL